MKTLSHILTTIICGCLLLPAVTALSSCTQGLADDPARDTAKVTLVLDAGTGTKTVNVDYSNEIRTIRIYAYSTSGGSADTPIGYFYDGPLSGNGPYYCTMHLDFTSDSQEQEVDFYVLVNDGAMEQKENQNITLDEESTRGAIESYMFRAVQTKDKDGQTYNAIPMSNLPQNRTFTICRTSTPQFIDIQVTRAMSRLRLQFAKVGEDVVTIDRATLYRGARYTWLTKEPLIEDAASMYINPDKLSGPFLLTPVPVTQIVSSIENREEKYSDIAETYMIENFYGTNSPNNRPEGPNSSRIYALRISYTINGTQKQTVVYLPSVKRNEIINVRGTLVSNSLQIKLQVLPWEVDENEIDFSTEYTGEFEKDTPYKVTEDNAAVAVSTSSDGTDRSATFKFRMASPVGATWTAHLSSTVDFRLEGTYSGIGTEDPEWTIFKVVPIHDYDSESPQTVRLFITVNSPFGGEMEDNGMQIINPLKDGVRPFPGNETEIEILQISENAYDALPD